MEHRFNGIAFGLSSIVRADPRFIRGTIVLFVVVIAAASATPATAATAAAIRESREGIAADAVHQFFVDHFLFRTARQDQMPSFRTVFDDSDINAIRNLDPVFAKHRGGILK
nr:hypothetical protein Hi04_10k_c5016_00040 [uncultured bacterium]